jgi:hypothetical protein
MPAYLTNRLRQLETRQRAIADTRINLRFGYLTKLPRTYAGERHIVEIDRDAGELSVYEERPGLGPQIESDPNTILVMLVAGPDEEIADWK